MAVCCLYSNIGWAYNRGISASPRIYALELDDKKGGCIVGELRYYSLTTAIEATALFVHVKGASNNYCTPRDPASWEKMAAIPDDCGRTATVALQTAASTGFISGEVGISAAVYRRVLDCV